MEPGPLNTNWGSGPVNTNWGPGQGAGIGGQGQGNTKTPAETNTKNRKLKTRKCEYCNNFSDISLTSKIAFTYTNTQQEFFFEIKSKFWKNSLSKLLGLIFCYHYEIIQRYSYSIILTKWLFLLEFNDTGKALLFQAKENNLVDLNWLSDEQMVSLKNLICVKIFILYMCGGFLHNRENVIQS